MRDTPERGITISSGELACEGVDTVLDAIAGTGATAIGVSPGMVVPAGADGGSREPPLDVDGQLRQLDRPLWGKRILNIHRYPVHAGDPDLWRDLPWEPPVAASAAIRTDDARRAIEGAHARGLRAYANLTPYALPGAPAGQESDLGSRPPHDGFRPQRIAGGPSPDAVAVTGCPNQPLLRELGRVRVREMLRHYGDVDGFAVDWVEYPAYFLDELFTCFCDHCRDQAGALGFDWATMTAAVRGLWDSLHTLSPEQLENTIASGDWGDLATDPDAIRVGIKQWLTFKAASTTAALGDLRETMNRHGGQHILLSANGFALPWGRMSGAAYLPDDAGVASQRVKLYSFHWLMMVRWWTETLLRWNRGTAVTPALMTRAVLSIFGIEMESGTSRPDPAAFGMPAPDTDHHLTPASYTDRLETALGGTDHGAPLMPIVHGYRSVDDFARLLDTVRPFAGEGLWVQRYGYLSDAKLDALRQAWGG